MSAVHWSRDAALQADPHAIDDLDGAGVLVIDGLRPDDRVPWLGRAPCVVMEWDVEADLDAVAAAVDANPAAARALVDVLRTIEQLDVERGLVVESLAYSLLLTGPEFAAWLAGQPRRGSKVLGDAVRIERDGAALHVTLARPANRNAFGAEMRDALVDALGLADVDDTIERITLAGEGPAFSSGGDLTEFGSVDDAVRAHQVRTLRSAGAAIARHGPKVEARINGACVGAGVEVSAFAGRVIAAPDTTFRLPEVGMGLIPGAGGCVSITKRIGRRRTARLALLGDAVDAEAALAWGLIDEIAP